jgi:phosphoglycerate kinase
MKTIKDFNVKGKRVLVRCDFNVPLSNKGEVLDDFRIKQTIPTIEYLIKEGAKVILMSHLGNPDGKEVASLKLDPIQEKLMQYLDCSITKAPDCMGSEIEKWSKEMQSGEILLLENLRFHKEEETNDDSFAKKLSQLGDIYLNDAFGTCHRAHASIVGVPKYLPAGAGLLLEKEIKVLGDLMTNPQKPLVVLVGGKKVETKSKFIDKISAVADCVLLGGLISKEIEEKNIKLAFPEKIIKPVDEIDGGLDIGFATRKLFEGKVLAAKTVFFNGVFGRIEDQKYTYGTKEVLKAIIESQAFSVIGGGETVELITKINWTEKFNHVSTGGGAMLMFLSGDKLPGLEALK